MKGGVWGGSLLHLSDNTIAEIVNQCNEMFLAQGCTLFSYKIWTRLILEITMFFVHRTSMGHIMWTPWWLPHQCPDSNSDSFAPTFFRLADIVYGHTFLAKFICQPNPPWHSWIMVLELPKNKQNSLDQHILWQQSKYTVISISSWTLSSVQPRLPLCHQTHRQTSVGRLHPVPTMKW